jgi:spore maturation protein CgeB
MRGEGVEYSAFVPALNNLGHEVVHFDSANRQLYRDFAQLNRELLEAIDRERPAVILTVQRDYEIWNETLDLIRARDDAALISWTTDDS